MRNETQTREISLSIELFPSDLFWFHFQRISGAIDALCQKKICNIRYREHLLSFLDEHTLQDFWKAVVEFSQGCIDPLNLFCNHTAGARSFLS